MNFKKPRVLTRLTAAALAAFLALPLAPVSYAAGYTDGVGNFVDSRNYDLAYGVNLVQGTFLNGSGRQNEHYLTISKNSNITPVVAYGDDVYGAASYSNVTKMLSGKGYNLVAGTNGDFFTYDTGISQGAMVTDGILRTYGSNLLAVAFNSPEVGGAFLTYPNLSVSAVIDGSSAAIAIDNVNRQRSSNALTLYTPDFGSDTRTTLEGKHVVVDVTGDLRINGAAVTGTVSAILSGTAPAELKAGQMVLSATKSGPVSRLEPLKIGTKISINVTSANHHIDNCPMILGGYQRLIASGAVQSNLGSDRAPRTAIGFKPDGSYIVYTVDGRQSGYSMGLSLTELAQRLLALGCIDAVNLDGGGSTFMSVRYPGNTDFTVVSQPSDGLVRTVSNYLFFANQTPKNLVPARLHIYPQTPNILLGSPLTLTAKATEPNYHPVSLSSAPVWSLGDAEHGTVTPNGVYTAAATGTVRIIASADGVTGETTANIVDKISSLTIVNQDTNRAVTSLNVNTNQTVNLGAMPYLDSVAITAVDSTFTWSVVGNIGTIDNNGVFVSGTHYGATGSVVVAGGGLSVTIPVSVGRLPEPVETFETDPVSFSAGGSGFVSSVEADRSYVKVGFRAGKLSYDFAAVEPGSSIMSLGAATVLPNNPSHLDFWLYGDGSGNTVSFTFGDAAGQSVTVSAAALDFVGYKSFSVTLPANTERINSINIIRSDGGKQSGSIWIDHIIARYNSSPLDTDPPAVKIISMDRLSKPGFIVIDAQIQDSRGVAMRSQDIKVTFDGIAQTGYTYKTDTNILQVTIAEPSARGLHIFTIDAAGAAGIHTRVREEIDLGDSTKPSSFYDIDNGTHWAKDYVTLLDSRNILTGTESFGIKYFDPDKSLKRSDMAVFICRFLGVDAAKYANTVLPYSDWGMIPTYCLNEVKAMYALGIIKGKSVYDGTVRYDPNANINRDEFITIIGRTLPSIYPVSVMTYPDWDQVQDFAKPHTEVMISLGIVSGYPDGLLHPQESVLRCQAAKILALLM